VSFTPRALPTPLRESKVAEESEWLMRNQLARAQAAASAVAGEQQSGGAGGQSRPSQQQQQLADGLRNFYRGVALAESGDAASAASAFDAAGTACAHGDALRAASAWRKAASAHLVAGHWAEAADAADHADALNVAAAATTAPGSTTSDGGATKVKEGAHGQGQQLHHLALTAAVRLLAQLAAGSAGPIELAAAASAVDALEAGNGAGAGSDVLRALLDIALACAESARLKAAASALAAAGHPAKAEAALTAAVAAQPCNVAARRNAGTLALQRGDAAACLRVCDDALPPAPTAAHEGNAAVATSQPQALPPHHSGLVAALLGAAQTPSATSAFQLRADLYQMRARCLWQAGALGGALEDLAAAARLVPGDAAIEGDAARLRALLDAHADTASLLSQVQVAGDGPPPYARLM